MLGGGHQPAPPPSDIPASLLPWSCPVPLPGPGTSSSLSISGSWEPAHQPQKENQRGGGSGLLCLAVTVSADHLFLLSTYRHFLKCHTKLVLFYFACSFFFFSNFANELLILTAEVIFQDAFTLQLTEISPKAPAGRGTDPMHLVVLLTENISLSFSH